eukprot:scaffold14717_cov168-Ochromonas_danica.AAC.2
MKKKRMKTKLTVLMKEEKVPVEVEGRSCSGKTLSSSSQNYACGQGVWLGSLLSDNRVERGSE